MELWEKFRNSKGLAPEDIKPREVKPWDLLDSDRPKVSDGLAQHRLDICKSCPHYIGLTHQCKKCGCIMNLKVKLAEASCPVFKWEAQNEGN